MTEPRVMRARLREARRELAEPTSPAPAAIQGACCVCGYPGTSSAPVYGVKGSDRRAHEECAA